MLKIGQTSHTLSDDEDVVIPWTALASSQSKTKLKSITERIVKYGEKNAYLKIDLLSVDHGVIPQNDCLEYFEDAPPWYFCVFVHGPLVTSIRLLLPSMPNK